MVVVCCPFDPVSGEEHNNVTGDTLIFIGRVARGVKTTPRVVGFGTELWSAS
jgi:hypothetical protein